MPCERYGDEKRENRIADDSTFTGEDKPTIDIVFPEDTD
jgi:hypothetical protein